MDILVHLSADFRDPVEVPQIPYRKYLQPNKDEQFVMVALGGLHVGSIDSLRSRTHN